MAGSKRKFSNFSIEAILEEKKFKSEECFLKQERPESPSSTTPNASLYNFSFTSFDSEPSLSYQSPLISCSSPQSISCSSPPYPTPSSTSSSSSPLNPIQFPLWTQCQRDVRKSRRPYSRHTVTILSWWFHHLPFLTVEEMEMVSR